MKTHRLTIAITGLQNAGKTSFTQRLLTGTYFESQPTLGVDVEFAEYRGHPLQIWDMGGHMAFRKHIWENYIKQSSAVIYIFDASDLSNMKEGAEWFWKVLSWIDKKGLPILFLANKWDLVENREKVMEEVITGFRLDELAESDASLSFRFFFISVKTGEYISDAMNWLVLKHFTEKEKISTKIVSFDLVTLGKDFLVHIHDNNEKRQEVQYIIDSYRKKWNKKGMHSLSLVEEMQFNSNKVLFISYPDKSLLLISKEDGIDKTPVLRVLDKMTEFLPLQKQNEAFELFDFIKQELTNLFLSTIATSLSCEISLLEDGSEERN